jgi:hypothetical protein
LVKVYSRTSSFSTSPAVKLNFQLRLRCACAATAMRERCDFHRSTIAIGNAFIDYTVFIPRIRTRIAIAAHAHRSRDLKRFHRLYSVHLHRSVIAASHTHRSRSARASQSQLEIKLKTCILNAEFILYGIIYTFATVDQ